MKVNLNQPFKSYDGTDLTENVEVTRFDKKVVEKKPVVIAESLAQHLYMGNGLRSSGDQQKDDAEKFQAYKLCQRIMSTKTPIDLSIEEMALIKKVASYSLAPGAYGQIVELMEGKEGKK